MKLFSIFIFWLDRFWGCREFLNQFHEIVTILVSSVGHFINVVVFFFKMMKKILISVS